MLFNAMVTQVLLYRVEVRVAPVSLYACNEIDYIQKMFLRRQLGVKCNTSCQIMLLETGVRQIEISALQRVYRYITKVKNIPHHRLPHLSWNVRCKLQKNHRVQFSHSVGLLT